MLKLKLLAGFWMAFCRKGKWAFALAVMLASTSIPRAIAQSIDIEVSENPACPGDLVSVTVTASDSGESSPGYLGVTGCTITTSDDKTYAYGDFTMPGQSNVEIIAYNDICTNTLTVTNGVNIPVATNVKSDAGTIISNGVLSPTNLILCPVGSGITAPTNSGTVVGNGMLITNVTSSCETLISSDTNSSFAYTWGTIYYTWTSNGVLVTNLPATFTNAGSYSFEGYVNYTPPTNFPLTNVITVDVGPLSVYVQKAVLSLGGANVFVNADDDNHDGIADKDDPTSGQASYVANEWDLIPLTLTLQSVLPSQTVTLSVSSWGGKVRVWTSANRGPRSPVLDTSATATTSWAASNMPAQLWVEGVAASSSNNDVSLTLSIDSGYTNTNYLTVIDMSSVVFQSSTSQLFANSNAGGGLAIYPDLPTPSATGDFSAVTVVATITPAVPGITLYFEAFDVGDPSLLTSPPDNNGTSPDGAFTITANTDANGRVSTNFHVSMQPGDNFRVVASPLANFPGDCVAANTNDPGALWFSGGTNEIPANCTSPMLTVWRRLHVEVDSMAAIGPGSNAVFGNIVGLLGNPATGATNAALDVNLVTGLTPTDNSLNLDSLPAPGNGRFENGSILIGTPGSQQLTTGLLGNGTNYIRMPTGSSFSIPFTITGTNVGTNSGVKTTGRICSLVTNAAGCAFGVTTPLMTNLFNGGTLVVMGQTYTVATNTATNVLITTTGVTLPFSMVDDDDNTILPRNPDTTDLARAFKPAYVTPFYDLTNARPTAPFVANLAQDTQATKLSMYAYDNAATAFDSGFWTIYLLGAFQQLTEADDDPNLEGGTLGEVDALYGQGAMIFLEVLRETPATTYVSEQYTVSHEVGHLFGGSHDPINGYDGGLMDQSSTRTNVDFTPTTLNKIRRTPHP
jgi:hypothetical protein